jgi:rhamnogalacturonan endolyase
MHHYAPQRTLLISLSLVLALLIVPCTFCDQESSGGQPSAPVQCSQDQVSFVLTNGILTARISKESGDMTSLVYKGIELLSDRSGHPGAYWSHDTTGGVKTVTAITIEPNSNGQTRAEVSVKGISGGRKMGHGPGAGPEGNIPADIEIRYCLGRGESGIYTYCIFEHKREYGAAAMCEARFCAKLVDMFDWMNVSALHNRPYPHPSRGDKYIYTAVQSENPAYGWSSTTKGIGFYFINPSMEYMSGGPTKAELLCHGEATVLNYWRSSHYGGSVLEVSEGEHWTKVVGPFMLYVNSGGSPQAMWEDAKAQAARESAKWPYQWVSGVDYPHSGQRATVKGRLVLKDPQMPGAKLPNLRVGLAHPAYDSLNIGGAVGSRPRRVDWQLDAKHYQFWVRGSEDGAFSIPNVRSGTYTLHAIADGVLGEYTRADVKVKAGESLDLGALEWVPVRRGRQLWDIGIPDRSGAEFRNGDRYFEPDAPLQYVKLFPDDVNYVIGRSDFRKDWYFEHVPHSEDPNAIAMPFFGVSGQGRATPFSVTFELSGPPTGTATLRLAICGNQAKYITVAVNDKLAGTIDNLASDGAITRHGIQAIWQEKELSFDASLMRKSTNVLRLIVPAGSPNAGVIYDYIRLELDEKVR